MRKLQTPQPNKHLHINGKDITISNKCAKPHLGRNDPGRNNSGAKRLEGKTTRYR